MDAYRRMDDNRQVDVVLHTERLTLLPFAESDLDITLEMFTDPEVRRHTGGAMDEADVRKDFAKSTRRGGNGCIGIWCITDRETGEKLGTGALLPMPIEDHITDYDLLVPGSMPDADIEIGYFLKPSAWGRGYATEATRRLLQMAFEESPLAEVVATCAEANEESWNVLLKSGFTYLGKRRCYGVEGPFFRITREEYLAQRG